MSFNRRMAKQELLSKEDIELLIAALDNKLIIANDIVEERISFLRAKLKRMKS